MNRLKDITKYRFWVLTLIIVAGMTIIAQPILVQSQQTTLIESSEKENADDKDDDQFITVIEAVTPSAQAPTLLANFFLLSVNTPFELVREKIVSLCLIPFEKFFAVVFNDIIAPNAP